MKTIGNMGTTEIILTITPVLWIMILLRADLIYSQTTADPTGPTMTPSLSTITPFPISESGTNTNSTSTTAMMTTAGGSNTGDNGTTVNTEGASADLTTPTMSAQPQPTTDVNEDNVTTSSDMGNSTSTPEMGNSTLTSDMGNSTSTLEMDTTTSTPDMVNSTSTPGMLNSTSAPDMGNSTSILDLVNTTSTPDMEASTSLSDRGNSTSSDSVTTDGYETEMITSEYTAIVTDGSVVGNSTRVPTKEKNSTMDTITWDHTTMNTTMGPETTATTDEDAQKRNGTSIPVALYMCISVILALCVVLLMGVIAHACASMRSRPTSYDVSSRVNGHQNPAFDSGEVADDDEDNPVKGIMREPRVDIESGMYSDNERTPL